MIPRNAIFWIAWFITDKLDLVVTDFDVLPMGKEVIYSIPSTIVFDYTFTFAINKGPTSTVTDPTSFKYKLVMSADGSPDDPTFTQVRATEQAHSEMATKTVTGNL